jgi:hypothetical protein
MELMDMNGKVIVKTEYKNIGRTIITYQRKPGMPKGMYLLKLINKATSKIDVYKVFFE